MENNPSLDIPIPISDNQNEFLQSEERGLIFQGGIRSGKSFILCLWAIKRAMEGRRVCIVSFSYRTLIDVVLKIIQEEILNVSGLIAGKDYEVKTSDLIIKIWRGEIMLRSGDRPDALRGLTLDDFGIDEARDFKDDLIFKIMIGRLSKSQNGQWRIATSPRGHDWVWELSKKTKTITQKTFDNPFLNDTYLQEVSGAYSGKFKEQELNGAIVEMDGNLIKTDSVKFVEVAEWREKTKGFFWTRGWDIASSEEQRMKDDPDFTAGVKCSVRKINNMPLLFIDDIKFGKWEAGQRNAIIQEIAMLDGDTVPIGIEAFGGYKDAFTQIRDALQGRRTVTKVNLPGDKVAKATRVEAIFAYGNVYCKKADWNTEFISQFADFPAGRCHDDLVDATVVSYSMHSNMVIPGRI